MTRFPLTLFRFRQATPPPPETIPISHSITRSEPRWPGGAVWPTRELRRVKNDAGERAPIDTSPLPGEAQRRQE